MLRLHWVPDNASLIVRLALEARGLPYETVRVDREGGALASSAFRALNPAGTIPVLETPDGVLTETGAILLWLEGGVPEPEALSRLFWLSNTPHADLRRAFYADRYASDPADLRHHLGQKLRAGFALMEPWEPSPLLEHYVACLLRWAGLYPRTKPIGVGWGDLPRLRAWALDYEARPTVVRACHAEGIEGPLVTAPVRPGGTGAA